MSNNQERLGDNKPEKINFDIEKRVDGSFLVTSKDWTGFRYILQKDEGLHQALDVFGPLLARAKLGNSPL